MCIKYLFEITGCCLILISDLRLQVTSSDLGCNFCEKVEVKTFILIYPIAWIEGNINFFGIPIPGILDFQFQARSENPGNPRDLRPLPGIRDFRDPRCLDFFYFAILIPGIQNFFASFYCEVSGIYALSPGIIQYPRYSGSFFIFG